MGNIIDGKALSAAVKEEVKAQVPELEAKYGRKPCLVVLIVGENPASQVYVRNKVKAAAYTGMESRLVELPADISEEALLNQIKALNEDPAVDGILVQLPLPKHIDEEKVIDTIVREKDVDGFHPGNVANLWLGKDCIVPCTPAGVMRMLDSIGVELKGKNAVVVGRSNIVGKPMAKLLLDRHATVTIAHSRTADLGAVCRTADVLVVAVGRAGLVTGDMVKPGAIVIDVGVIAVARVLDHGDHGAVIRGGDVIGDVLAFQRGDKRLDAVLRLVAVLDGHDVGIRAVGAFDQKALFRRLHARGDRVVRVDDGVVHVGQDARDLRGFDFLKGNVQRIFLDVVDRGGDADAVLQLDDAVFLQQNQGARFVGRVIRHGDRQRFLAAAGSQREQTRGQHSQHKKNGYCFFHR